MLLQQEVVVNVYLEIYHKATVGSFTLLSHRISTSNCGQTAEEGGKKTRPLIS